MGQGGIWRKRREEVMTTAGSSFLKLLEIQEILWEIVGLNSVLTEKPVQQNVERDLNANLLISQVANTINRSPLDNNSIHQTDIWDSCYLINGTKVSVDTSWSPSFIQDRNETFYWITQIYLTT
jgi:hypothetical protein